MAKTSIRCKYNFAQAVMSFFFAHILFCSCGDEIQPQLTTPNQPVDSASPKHNAAHAYDTMYTTIFLEDTLKRWGRFGMTVSEWNTMLALMAQQKKVANLYNSLHGGYCASVTQDGKYNYNICGVFKYQNHMYGENRDTIEIFFRDGKKLVEGVLVGIEKTPLIPSNLVNGVMDNMVIVDELKFLAGKEKMKPSKTKWKHSGSATDISIGSYLECSAENRTPINYNHEHKVEYEQLQKALYVGRLFYSIFEITENVRGVELCDKDHYVLSAEYTTDIFPKFTQTIYSKTQAGIQVGSYYTDDQKALHERENETKKLIEAAIKK